MFDISYCILYSVFNQQVSGNEESVARSVIFAAHNTAQLSAYVSDVANVSTDITLSESKSFISLCSNA